MTLRKLEAEILSFFEASHNFLPFIFKLFFSLSQRVISSILLQSCLCSDAKESMDKEFCRRKASKNATSGVAVPDKDLDFGRIFTFSVLFVLVHFAVN